MKGNHRKVEDASARYWTRLAQSLAHEYIGDSVLDVGCGESTAMWDTIFAKARMIVGIDLKRREIVSTYGGSYVRASARFIPFMDNTFDTVFCKDVIHHVEPRNKKMWIEVLRELHRVSRKFIIVIEANRHNPLSFLYMFLTRKHNHLTRNEFRDVIQRAFADGDVKIEISQAEVHFVPFGPRMLRDMAERVQDFVESTEAFRGFLNYNIARIRRNT